jgi:hypothetical protein
MDVRFPPKGRLQALSNHWNDQPCDLAGGATARNIPVRGNWLRDARAKSPIRREVRQHLICDADQNVGSGIIGAPSRCFFEILSSSPVFFSA